MEEHRIARCPNCGAEIELGPDVQATTCPFCDTPLILDTGTRRQIRPGAVLPFVLAEEQARDAMTRWLGSLWFAPNGLSEYARKGRRLNGVYVPFWTFDAQTRSRYSGERGTVYYETRTVMRAGRPEPRCTSPGGTICRICLGGDPPVRRRSIAHQRQRRYLPRRAAQAWG